MPDMILWIVQGGPGLEVASARSAVRACSAHSGARKLCPACISSTVMRAQRALRKGGHSPLVLT